MDPTLNRPRLLAVISVASVLCAVPVFNYWAGQFEMPTTVDVLINILLAIFVGLLAAGAILHLAAFALGGTLPKWFWDGSNNASGK